MYSNKLQSLLDRKRLKPGDRISVKIGEKQYEGLLMPRPDIGDPSCLVIKLDSGYNMGISYSPEMRIKKSVHKEPRAVKEEEEFELGKISRKLLRVKWNKRKPPVSLIAAGGTISSRVDYRTGGVHAVMKPEEILHNVPELVEIINLRKSLSIFTKMSEDLDHRDWIELAKATARELNSESRGVIITHGTDFLHYTAAALSFFLKELNKPVVLVGAQRSSDRGSSDAGMNLICSAHTAIGDIAEVGTCMHGSMEDSYCLFIRGTKVRKMDTQRRDAFRPVNDLPLARVWPDGKTEVLNPNHRKRSSGKVTLDARFESKVALIKVYPGSDPDIINYYLSKNYRGFVIEASGLGHVPTFARKSWIETIKKTIKDGIPVVTAPQTIYGRINPNVYTNLRILYHGAGAIPGQDMLPETAYVKLGYVLAKTKDPEEVRKLMLTNMAGEITERTLPETFLY